MLSFQQMKIIYEIILKILQEILKISYGKDLNNKMYSEFKRLIKSLFIS
jgi:hypothetical protein